MLHQRLRRRGALGRAPFVGEHNRPALREFLALSGIELDQLHGGGVLFEDVTVPHLDAVS